MTEVGFEWNPVTDESVVGYYLYRSNPNDANSKMQLVANIKDRFATHYVDRDLAPETTYSYQMRTYSSNYQWGREGTGFIKRWVLLYY